jgi:hypothetical protein
MNIQPSYRKDPQQLVETINNLIHGYQTTRSPLTALSIAQHLEVLCSHPDCEGQSIDCGCYLRMRAIWQLLSRKSQITTIAA